MLRNCFLRISPPPPTDKRVMLDKNPDGGGGVTWFSPRDLSLLSVFLMRGAYSNTQDLSLPTYSASARGPRKSGVVFPDSRGHQHREQHGIGPLWPASLHPSLPAVATRRGGRGVEGGGGSRLVVFLSEDHETGPHPGATRRPRDRTPVFPGPLALAGIQRANHLR